MKAKDLFWPGQCLFIEIGPGSMKVLNGDRGIELPLERLETGRLTPGCREALARSLQAFLNQKPWRWRHRAYVAIGASGVTLRRMSLPSAESEELRRLVMLQMESEFPLPPESLAWGYCRLNGRSNANGREANAAGQELVVAAVKREVLEDYNEVLSQCGLSPVYTLGALARSAIAPPQPDRYALLDVGQQHAELMSFERGVVTGIRLFPWTAGNPGSNDESGGIGHAEGKDRRVAPAAAGTSPATSEMHAPSGLDLEAQHLAQLIAQRMVGPRLYVTGESDRTSQLLAALGESLGAETRLERIGLERGAGLSAATAGLKRLSERNGGDLPLVLEVQSQKAGEVVPKPVRWHWAALAGLLILCSFSLRYAEAFLRQGRLARRLNQIRSYRDGLPRIDRELSFLQYIENNQPPLLDALYVIANAAPGGTRLDFVSMNRRGDVSLRGMMPNAQQATDFRSKLIDSGFFNGVVLDEQAPAPDRQRVQFRLSAQWKPNGQRPHVNAPPVPKSDMSSMPPGTGGPMFMPGPSMMAPNMGPSPGGPGPGGPPAPMRRRPGPAGTPLGSPQPVAPSEAPGSPQPPPVFPGNP